MEISLDLIENLKNCKWLEHCGCNQSTNYSFEVSYVKNFGDAIKLINSSKWENVCLEESGNITSYLSVHYGQEYNRLWNTNTREIKTSILPAIQEELQNTLISMNLPENVLDDVKFNLVAILTIDSFSEFYKSQFYSNLLDVYLSGHLPCGWDGEYPFGKIIVY